MADPGLPPLGSDLPELSDAVADPVRTVTEAATTTADSTAPAVEQVESAVVGVVEDATRALGTATAGNSTRLEEYRDDPSSVSPTTSAAATPAAPSPPAPTAPVATVADEPELGSPGTLPVVAGNRPQRSAEPLAERPAPAAPPRARTGVVATAAAPAAPPATLPATPNPLWGSAVRSVRDGGSDEPRFGSQAEPVVPGGIAAELPSPMPLVIALLGLLALAAPRARGPRLSLAVTSGRAADVRFRLVRPG